MKQILTLILSLLLVVPGANAQNNKALERALKKEYKSKMKELKKEGWKLYGSSRSLDVVLLQHYQKLNDPELVSYEIMGSSTQFSSKSIGHQQCITNASAIYAQSARRLVQGRITTDFGATGNVKEEFEHFYAAYESLIEKEINGELQESFSLIREVKKGVFEMQSYFIVSEDAATKARIRAYENALRESEAAQKYSNQISNFIKEGFNPNEE